MLKIPITELPQKDRFDLPEVLAVLKSLDLTRKDLFEFLRLGRVHTVCFPYRLEPDREIAINPDQWSEMFRDGWAFSPFHGWIGDTNVAELDTEIPLNIVPNAASADCHRILEDGGKAATSATVYVLRNELIRFLKWLKNPTKSRPGHRKKGAGRPEKHDYSNIDACLKKRFNAMGLSGFERQSDVIVNLKAQLGDVRIIPDSTLRNHINSWLRKRTTPNG